VLIVRASSAIIRKIHSEKVQVYILVTLYIYIYIYSIISFLVFDFVLNKFVILFLILGL